MAHTDPNNPPTSDTSHFGNQRNNPKPSKTKDFKRVPRMDVFKHLKHRAKRKVCEALVCTGGNVSQACELAGVTRSTPYVWGYGDPVFHEAFELARTMAAEVLEDEARRRAFDGVDEPVGWYQGKPGGYIRRYSDNLLMFTL